MPDDAAENSTHADRSEFVSWVYCEYRDLIFWITGEYITDIYERNDLVQDCAVKIMQSAEQLLKMNRSEVRYYVTALARNTARNYLKHRRRGEKRITYIDDQTKELLPDCTYSIEDIVTENDDVRILYQAIEMLPEEDKMLLESKYILEESDEQIAAQLGCTKDSVRMKLTRARRRAAKEISNIQEGRNIDESHRA